MENIFKIPSSYEKAYKPYVIDHMKYKRLGIMSDIHVPYHSVDALNIAFDHLRKQRVDSILLNGDIIDFHKLSSFVHDPESVDLVEELRILKEFLLSLKSAFPKCKIFYKIGNHENRLQRYLKIKAPELFFLPYFDYEEFLGLKQLGISLIDDNQIIFHGKLAILHGHEIKLGAGAVNPARSLYLKFKDSSVVGHLHRTSQHTEKTGTGKVISTWSLGCLCELTPAYAPLNAWNHGFALNIIDDDNGSYELFNHKIVKGKVV